MQIIGFSLVIPIISAEPVSKGQYADYGGVLWVYDEYGKCRKATAREIAYMSDHRNEVWNTEEWKEASGKR